MQKKTEISENKKSSVDMKLVLIVVSLVLALGVVWGAVWLLTPKTKDSPSPQVTTVQEHRSASGKTSDQDKQDATLAVSEILKTADKSPTGKQPLEMIQILDTGDFTVVDKALPGMIRFSDSSTEGFQIATYQALVTMSAVLKDKTSDDNFKTISAEAWRSSFADSELGTVFVPLNIFTGGGESFSLEMVFVDGQWKLAPYSLIEAVRISSMLGVQPTSPALPSPSPTK